MTRLPDCIETARLLIRRYTEDDAAALSVAIATSVEHLRPWMAWIASEPLSLRARIDLIRRWDAESRQDGDVVFGVFLGDEIVGGTGFHRRLGPDGLEIGYWVHPDHLRRGYASEASAALTSVAFTIPGIDRVEIHHDQANVASAGVPAGLGYTLIAQTPDEIAAPGEIGIDWAWRMRRTEWLARPER